MTLHLAVQHRFAGFSLDVDVSAPPGLTALFGPSGSGKTTLVNAVAGLLTPDQGRIAVEGWVLLDTARGHALPPHRRRLGYIFQEGRLFPHFTVRQNLRYGQWFAPRGARVESLDHVVDMLGIGPLLGRRPVDLSGGEKQRVAIGRALLAAPRLILADEPLAALDEARKAEILPYFERLRDEVSVPILYVSHSSEEVARVATTVIALEDGRVTAHGPPEEVLGPMATRPARGPSSLLQARIARHHLDGLTELTTEGGAVFVPRLALVPGTALRLRIAAQEVILAREAPHGLSALSILRGRVASLHPCPGPAPGVMVVLAIGEGQLLARITQRAAQALGLQAGDTCHAILKCVDARPDDTAP